MCVKFPPKDLNSGSYPSHPTSTYTCGVTTALRVCSGELFFWGLVYFDLDFRSKNFVMIPKMRKMLELQAFL